LGAGRWIEHEAADHPSAARISAARRGGPTPGAGERRRRGPPAGHRRGGRVRAPHRGWRAQELRDARRHRAAPELVGHVDGREHSPGTLGVTPVAQTNVVVPCLRAGRVRRQNVQVARTWGARNAWGPEGRATTAGSQSKRAVVHVASRQATHYADGRAD